MQDLLDKAEEVDTSSGLPLARAYRGFVECLRSLEADVNAHGTTYCQLLYGDVSKKIEALVKGRYESDAVSREAELTVDFTEKTYDWSEPDCKLRLDLEIANSGEGVAYETSLRVVESEGIELLTPSLDIGDVGNQSRRVSLLGQVTDPDMAGILHFEISWKNGNEASRRWEDVLELPPHAISPDWETLRASGSAPFSLDAVGTAPALVDT